MNRWQILGLAAWLSCVSTLAQAACENGLAERMHNKLHPTRTLDKNLAACKVWPAYAGRSIVVLPLLQSSSDHGLRTFDLEVLLIQRPDNGNTERDVVLAQLFLPEALEESENSRIQDLRIDTSRYALAAGTRAFGLRLRYQGTRRTSPLVSETLRLYSVHNTQLKKVLDEVELQRDGGEWDLQCNGHFEQLRTLVTVGPNHGAGLADLHLARSLTRSRAQLQSNGSCSEKATPPQYETVAIKYAEGRYLVPKELRIH